MCLVINNSLLSIGWTLINGNLKIKWLTKPPSPKALLENVSCNCQKSNCNTQRCICKKNDLYCTRNCGCGDSCVNENEESDNENLNYNSSDVDSSSEEKHLESE